MCSLLILLHVYLHVHILKITYYISWLTGTLQSQYLQLKHNTVTDIDSRTIELYAPLNNLISLTLVVRLPGVPGSPRRTRRWLPGIPGSKKKNV